MEIHLIVDEDLFQLCNVSGDSPMETSVEATTSIQETNEKKRPASEMDTKTDEKADKTETASEAGSTRSRRSATPEPAKKKKKVDPVSFVLFCQHLVVEFGTKSEDARAMSKEQN